MKKRKQIEAYDIDGNPFFQNPKYIKYFRRFDDEQYSFRDDELIEFFNLIIQRVL